MASLLIGSHLSKFVFYLEWTYLIIQDNQTLENEYRIHSFRGTFTFLLIFGKLLWCRYYTTRLWIGTPPQRFALIVDTGSTVTYVPCSTCEQCGKHQVGTFLIILFCFNFLYVNFDQELWDIRILSYIYFLTDSSSIRHNHGWHLVFYSFMLLQKLGEFNVVGKMCKFMNCVLYGSLFMFMRER